MNIIGNGVKQNIVYHPSRLPDLGDPNAPASSYFKTPVKPKYLA